MNIRVGVLGSNRQPFRPLDGGWTGERIGYFRSGGNSANWKSVSSSRSAGRVRVLEQVMSNDHIRHGIGAVRPYLYGDLATVEFVITVFGAELLERNENLGTSPGYHVEAKIGDSVVVIEASDAWVAAPRTQSVYVYVADVDDAYIRAIAMGGTPVDDPEDKPYQERACAVRDPYGNTWYIAAYTG